MNLEPFPHEDGAPASLQDKMLMSEARESKERSERNSQDIMRMLLSTMK